MTPARRMPSMSVIGPALALILLVVAGAMMNENFLSFGNITNVLARSAFIGIIAVGMTFVITAGGLDLSVGSMAAFIAGLMILVMNKALPSMGVGVPIVLLGMGVALLAGLIAGLVNGLLITKLGIEAFIVTLGSMGIYRSLVTWLADGGTLSLDFGLRTFTQPIYYGGILGVSWPIIVFALVVIGGEILMRHTAFGRHCAAIGSNEQVAKYSAVRVARVKLATYVMLGLLVGVATIMYVPRLGSASAATGLLWELEAIAAVIIGGTVLKGGFGRVWGTVIGVLILVLIGNILNLTDFVSPYLNGAIQGAIIVLAVVLQRDTKPGRRGGALSTKIRATELAHPREDDRNEELCLCTGPQPRDGCPRFRSGHQGDRRIDPCGNAWLGGRAELFRQNHR